MRPFEEPDAESSTMPWVDIIGYVGAVFVLVAYTMKTMIPLRMMAIGSNVAAIIYGVLAGLKPILFLHLTLLPSTRTAL